MNISKPILKWVGGKTKILSFLMDRFPKTVNNYHEPFVGGGSVLLQFLLLIKNGNMKVYGNIFAYDLNEPLIGTYINIKNQHVELYKSINTLIDEYRECCNGIVNRKPKTFDEAQENSENYYYWIRTKYNNLSNENKISVDGSAMFIFLNKTCFRGMFRIGPNGFNVPFGHYTNPEIINFEHLTEIHDLIQCVTFKCCDFNDALSDIKVNDFVYLDPPYAPETKTSFVGYTEDGFCLEKHMELFELLHGLTFTDKKIMMSNADVNLVRENFTDDLYTTESILCNRFINSKNPGAKANEVVITNY